MFNIGDKVLIDPTFDKNIFDSECQYLVGKIVTIKNKDFGRGYYSIKEEYHYWNKKYLIPLKVIKT